MPFLEARGLSKTYRDAEIPVQVFGNLNLDVERGELLAIVGPSGIGKSTLLHLLGGLDRPDSGTIRVDTTEVTSMSNDNLAKFRNRNVGFVFQFHHLLPEFRGWNQNQTETPLRSATLSLTRKHCDQNRRSTYSGTPWACR